MNENRTQSPPKNRFYILDLMRFLAALAVVFYHYSIYFRGTFFEVVIPIANYGYLGVPFFFMLSGFVITASAQNRSAIQFALSRMARLYPAFWACLLFTCGIVFYLKGGGIGFGQAAINSTMLNDYLGVKNIDDVYWTLQAEIKFYGCIFVLLVLNLYKYVKTWLVIWLCLAILFHFYNQPFFLGWLINPSYSFYFIGGVCSYLLYENKRNYFILCVFAVAMIFSALKASHQVADFYSASGAFGQYIAVGVVVIFYIFFMCLSFRALNLKPFRMYALMGSVSYPLYLCHNRAGKALIDSISQSLPMTATIILVIFFILAVSLLVHFIVERNLSTAIIQVGNKLIQRATVLLGRHNASY
jgi:peptidoglycan/LPS O-acetylase OafA/YrhL